jgi:predicted Fe-S protein YdhL (DUF1289 family)
MKNDVCVGCKRTTKEIADWSKLSNDDRRIIVERIKNTYDDRGTSLHSS